MVPWTRSLLKCAFESIVFVEWFLVDFWPSTIYVLSEHALINLINHIYDNSIIASATSVSFVVTFDSICTTFFFSSSFPFSVFIKSSMPWSALTHDSPLRQQKERKNRIKMQMILLSLCGKRKTYTRTEDTDDTPMFCTHELFYVHISFFFCYGAVYACACTNKRNYCWRWIWNDMLYASWSRCSFTVSIFFSFTASQRLWRFFFWWNRKTKSQRMFIVVGMH